MGAGASNEETAADDDSEIADQLHLLESGDQSDLLLICEGRYFNVHSHIVSARSDILKVLIQELRGKRSLVINEVGAHALGKMLHYMYSGKVPEMSTHSALKVHDAANKYCLQGLEKKCATIIKSKLNEMNVCDVLVHSDQNKATYLKDVAITYLLNNKSFLKSENWRRFSEQHAKLANEVHLSYIKRY